MTVTEERVRAACRAWVWVPDGARSWETDDYLLVRYPPWMDVQLALARFTPRRPVDVVVDEVVETARTTGLPHVRIWVTPDTPAGTAELLGSRGAEPSETLDVLAADLGAGVPDLGTWDAELRWATDVDVLRDAQRVGAEVFGGEVAPEDELARQIEVEGPKVAAGLGGGVVAYVDGRPVASGGLTVAGADARLWGGAVVEDVRGRGLYRAVLHARLAFAAEHGADLALVKGRVATSGPILRRAGFTPYGQERAFEVPLT